MAPTQPKSPFDLPELREIIRGYLTKTDALACSRVCRTWSGYFRDLVWHTIDFAEIRLGLLAAGAIARHGHHIRAVKNLQSSSQIDLLMYSYKHNLLSLSVTLSAELSYQTDLFDYLRLVRSSLTELDLAIEAPKTVASARDAYGYPSYASRSMPAVKINVPVDVILPRGPSRLTSIVLRGLHLSRLSLLELLRGCPDLQDLTLKDMSIPNRSLYADWTFKHSNLRHLTASFEAIVAVPSEHRLSASPQLISLFPALERWTVWTDGTLQPSSLRSHSGFVRLLCPKLKAIALPVESTVVVKEFVAHIFTRIESLTFMHQALSSEVIIAILKHSKTLKHISYLPPPTFKLEDPSNPPPLNDHFRNSTWTLQEIPRLCPHLETFSFPLSEMDMDDIESGTWECKGLKVLHIRIAGLNKSTTIDAAIALWLDGRLFHQRNERLGHITSPTAKYLLVGRTLESRVAAHLLKFNDLHSIWLGTRVWTV